MRRKIMKCIEDEINPMIASHNGRIEFVDYINNDVFIEMQGGCKGCAASTATLNDGVEKILRERFGDDIREIVDVTNHSEGVNPYYE